MDTGVIVALGVCLVAVIVVVVLIIAVVSAVSSNDYRPDDGK